MVPSRYHAEDSKGVFITSLARFHRSTRRVDLYANLPRSSRKRLAVLGSRLKSLVLLRSPWLHRLWLLFKIILRYIFYIF